MHEAIVIILGAVVVAMSFVLKKQNEKVKMEQEVKQVILSLFLFAEKQGWTGQDKMAYVAQKMYDMVPGSWIEKVIEQESLTAYLQNMYNSFKDGLYK